MSPEEIARIKVEWEAKEARKEKKEKDKETAAADGDASGESKKDDGGKDKAASLSSSAPGTPSSPSVTIPTFKQYSLRNFYAMRQAEHRRRKEAKQTQELAPRLPGAPYGSLQ
jgi:hypothetical protein